MSSDNDPCLTHLPTSQVIGLSFTAVSGFVSCLAIFFVLALVARNYIRNVKHPPPGGDWKLIRTHVDAYLLSLLASDILQGIGAILDLKWVTDKRVYCSATCTAQGIIQQIGETGVAMATFAIALHTFLVIFFRWSPGPRSAWIWRIGIAFIWVYLILFALIAYAIHHRPSNSSSTLDDFFTPTPFWCWISSPFNAERIAGEYFWLWLAAFTSIFLYTLLFFRVRGNITVDPQNFLRIKFKWKRWEEGDEGNGDAYYGGSGRGARGGDAGKTAAKEALSMVWYPVTYTILVLPLSIVRWSTFRPPGHEQPSVPPVVTFIVVTIFGMSGITNVTLMLVTRKNLLLFGQRGVVNPARIGPTVTGRLGNRAVGGRGGGGGGGLNLAAARQGGGGAGVAGGEKQGRFAFRDGLAFGKFKGDPTHDDSTDETSADRNQGDTSFAAGRFTTQAFQTERSFDVGSAGGDRRIPGFTPTTPTSPISFPGAESYVYGIDQRLTQGDPLSMDGGIPEGMSRDLGSAGEYDIDREKEWRSFGSTPISPAYVGGGGLVSSRPQEQEISSDIGNRSNFLELSKDSKSPPGSSTEYIPTPATYPPVPVLSSPQPKSSYDRPPGGSSFDPEVRRGSAASQGKASSTRRPSDTDYSVPMKVSSAPLLRCDW